VAFYLSERISQLREKGVNDIILDPGFGFGKTIAHNYELLRNLQSTSIGDLPILAGISRKSMIFKPLEISSLDSLNATISLNSIALSRGAKILRVHDVKPAVEAIKLHSFVNDPTSL
jgi:dihydropteroate synthase